VVASTSGFGLKSADQALRAPHARPLSSLEKSYANAREMSAGTLAYMAPEQTGRMNRSIDARSDLYAVGVTLYQIHGRSALHGDRSDRMGALPYCKTTGAAQRAVKKPPRLGLCDHYEHSDSAAPAIGSTTRQTKRYLYWSDGSYRTWGFDPLHGLPSRQSMWERIHPEDRD